MADRIKVTNQLTLEIILDYSGSHVITRFFKWERRQKSQNQRDAIMTGPVIAGFEAKT